jgi:hypothetical protein
MNSVWFRKLSHDLYFVFSFNDPIVTIMILTYIMKVSGWNPVLNYIFHFSCSFIFIALDTSSFVFFKVSLEGIWFEKYILRLFLISIDYILWTIIWGSQRVNGEVRRNVNSTSFVYEHRRGITGVRGGFFFNLWGIENYKLILRPVSQNLHR